MIDMEYIRGFYPPYIAQNAAFQKHMLKEYVELLALEWIARSPYAAKLIFIGGTNLRLIHGIDRFSEDLDFDCKGLSESDFRQMSDDLVRYLQLQGLNAELRNKENSRITAFRSNVHFPRKTRALIILARWRLSSVMDSLSPFPCRLSECYCR